MSDGLVLHDFPLDARCYAARLLLSLLGVEARRVPVDMAPGREHLGERYLALNPRGGLPILEDGGLVVAGMVPVLAHLARTRDPSGAWLPLAPPAFTEVVGWLAFAAQELESVLVARDEAIFGEGEGGHVAAARRALRLMDDAMTRRALAGAAWFAGEAGPTVADVALFPGFALSRDCGIDHDEFPALRSWARRVRRLPGFVTMPGIPDYH